ncbi:MAG: hypothetical protein OXH84_00935 [Gammaproteobacteria bacterium]|nr:hypothetical protein [Gammaproteobacteria bacterium]
MLNTFGEALEYYDVKTRNNAKVYYWSENRAEFFAQFSGNYYFAQDINLFKDGVETPMRFSDKRIIKRLWKTDLYQEDDVDRVKRKLIDEPLKRQKQALKNRLPRWRIEGVVDFYS